MLLRTKKKKHESALHSDELTTVMYYSCCGGVAIFKRRLINMMGDKRRDRSRLVWAKRHQVKKSCMSLQSVVCRLAVFRLQVGEVDTFVIDGSNLGPGGLSGALPLPPTRP